MGQEGYQELLLGKGRTELTRRHSFPFQQQVPVAVLSASPFPNAPKQTENLTIAVLCGTVGKPPPQHLKHDFTHTWDTRGGMGSDGEGWGGMEMDGDRLGTAGGDGRGRMMTGGNGSVSIRPPPVRIRSHSLLPAPVRPLPFPSGPAPIRPHPSPSVRTSRIRPHLPPLVPVRSRPSPSAPQPSASVPIRPHPFASIRIHSHPFPSVPITVSKSPPQHLKQTEICQ